MSAQAREFLLTAPIPILERKFFEFEDQSWVLQTFLELTPEQQSDVFRRMAEMLHSNERATCVLRFRP